MNHQTDLQNLLDLLNQNGTSYTQSVSPCRRFRTVYFSGKMVDFFFGGKLIAITK